MTASRQGMVMELMQDEAYFERVLGAAVVRKWADLPRSIQEALFEEAVLVGHRSQRDENLREQLALFLHNKHPRTEGQRA
jgi:hypothetical protein